MADLVLGFLIQMGLTVGLIVLFGFLIGLFNRLFYSNFGSTGRKICYVTGFIGTPIHELSHALFCLIFLHKITEMKLYTIGDDGTLGYVYHEYNPKNVYQRIGNFFIGIAPIVVISFILFIILNTLLPDLVADLTAIAKGMSEDKSSFFGGIWLIFKSLFSYMKYSKFWIYVAVGAFIVPHMTLSSEDVKGATGGFLFVAAALLIADVVVFLISRQSYTLMTGAFITIGAFLLTFFSLAFLVLLMELLLSFLFKLFFRKKSKNNQ